MRILWKRRGLPITLTTFLCSGFLCAGFIIGPTVTSFAQGPRPNDLGASKLDIGEPGIAWYTTWKTAEQEAERSGRPIMFVAAATQCNGISGVF